MAPGVAIVAGSDLLREIEGVTLSVKTSVYLFFLTAAAAIVTWHI